MFFSCDKKEKKKKTTLNLCLPIEAPTLDPRKGGDQTSSALHFLLFEPLTKVTKNSTSAPGVALNYDVSSDKLTYTFHLGDAKWSDGSDLTAYDYEYSWKSMLKPTFPCPNSNLLYFIKNAEQAKKGQLPVDDVPIIALDKKTLSVTLEKPTPFFPNIISFCVFSPVKANIVKNHSNWADKLSETYIGNGPYRIKSWIKEKEIVLEKNPHYWRADQVKLQNIHFHIVPNSNTALGMFEQKELDILGGSTSDIPTDAIPYLEKQGYTREQQLPKTVFCAFNTNKAPFNNQWIRKAFSLAIDRQYIATSLPELRALPAEGLIAPILKSGETKRLFEPFNLAYANVCLQKGLEELNLSKKDLAKYTLSYSLSDEHTKVAQILQEGWRKNLGITINLQGFEKQHFYTKTNKGDIDLCLNFWMAQYDDPMNIFDRFRVKDNPKNYCKWSNEDYKNLLSQSYYLDRDERKQCLEKAETIFLEKLPLTPIYHCHLTYAIHPGIKGFYTSPVGSSHYEKIEFESN